MDSIIETQRAQHEAIERYEQALAEVLMQNPRAQRNITWRDRTAAEILERIGELRHNLVEMYEDLPGLRPTELALLSAPPPGEGVDELAEFYTRFEEIKDFHKRNPNVNAREFIDGVDEMVNGDGLEVTYVEDPETGHNQKIVTDPLDNLFSGEEAFGKHLDLYEYHSQYLNLKGSSRLSYIGYLDMLRHGRVERTLDLKEKSYPAYLTYVKGLYTYLVGFFERALPLIDMKTKLAADEAKFEADWEAGKVEEWSEGGPTKVANGGAGIWCPYCQKNYSKQTVYDAHLKSDKHKKKEATGRAVSQAEAGASAAGPSSSSRDKHKLPARYTVLVMSLLAFSPIPELLAESRSEVERRMALTAREREAEVVESEEAPPPVEEVIRAEEDEEDEDGAVYNPLKLPLGWDGKPIPFWLYKLHGLGVEFKCEICSDYVYMGRKAFDRHFQESRHAFGMRALGLPNTRHFHEITKIADALALADKLKREGRQELAAMEKAEEFEDADGNVYDKKTYEDLKRQGLL